MILFSFVEQRKQFIQFIKEQNMNNVDEGRWGYLSWFNITWLIFLRCTLYDANYFRFFITIFLSFIMFGLAPTSFLVNFWYCNYCKIFAQFNKYFDFILDLDSFYGFIAK